MPNTTGLIPLDDLKASALKYQRRGDWQANETNMYAAAQRRGVLDECCGHMEEVPDRIKSRVKAGTWTYDKCLKSARQFISRSEWESEDGKAYYAAVSRGWATEIAERLEWFLAGVDRKPSGYWCDPLRCILDAKQYETRSEWDANSRSAYSSAALNGWLNACCFHMENKVRQDEDSLYVWRVLSAKDEVVMPLPGFHLCKVGITSQHQNGKRITGCAQANDMEHEVIAHCDVSWQDGNDRGDAKAFESVLLSMGTDPQLPYWYDGKTEFRIYSDEEMEFIYQLMGVKEAQAEAA